MEQKLIMVLIDGANDEIASLNMGYLNHLVEQGLAAKYTVRAELPTNSRPLYEVLLTGTPACINGITSNNTVRLSHEKSLFHLTKENNLRNAAAAYYFISELYNRAPYNRFEDSYQEDPTKPIQYGRFYYEDSYPDSHLILDGEYLRKKYNPHFLLIHTMSTDNMGHLYGLDSREYRTSLNKVDNELSLFIPIWIEEGYHIVITADHGVNKDYYHGGIHDSERLVPLFVISKEVEPGYYEENIGQLLIPPLLCDLLGIERSEKMLKDKFPGYEKR